MKVLMIDIENYDINRDNKFLHMLFIDKTKSGELYRIREY